MRDRVIFLVSLLLVSSSGSFCPASSTNEEGITPMKVDGGVEGFRMGLFTAPRINCTLDINGSMIVQNFISSGSVSVAGVKINSGISRGATGPQGPRGIDGIDGTSGPMGPNGGPTGPVGPVGNIGPPGPTGNAGGVGPIGPTGQNGATGPIGATGAIGITGTPGNLGGMYPCTTTPDCASQARTCQNYTCVSGECIFSSPTGGCAQKSDCKSNQNCVSCQCVTVCNVTTNCLSDGCTVRTCLDGNCVVIDTKFGCCPSGSDCATGSTNYFIDGLATDALYGRGAAPLTVTGSVSILGPVRTSSSLYVAGTFTGRGIVSVKNATFDSFYTTGLTVSNVTMVPSSNPASVFQGTLTFNFPTASITEIDSRGGFIFNNVLTIRDSMTFSTATVSGPIVASNLNTAIFTATSLVGDSTSVTYLSVTGSSSFSGTSTTISSSSATFVNSVWANVGVILPTTGGTASLFDTTAAAIVPLTFGCGSAGSGSSNSIAILVRTGATIGLSFSAFSIQCPPTTSLVASPTIPTGIFDNIPFSVMIPLKLKIGSGTFELGFANVYIASSTGISVTIRNQASGTIGGATSTLALGVPDIPTIIFTR